MRRYLWLAGLVLAVPALAATPEQNEDYVSCERHHTLQTGPISVRGQTLLVTATDLAHYATGWEACVKVRAFWNRQPDSPDLTVVPPDDATVQGRIGQYQ